MATFLRARRRPAPTSGEPTNRAEESPPTRGANPRKILGEWTHAPDDSCARGNNPRCWPGGGGSQRRPGVRSGRRGAELLWSGPALARARLLPEPEGGPPGRPVGGASAPPDHAPAAPHGGGAGVLSA